MAQLELSERAARMLLDLPPYLDTEPVRMVLAAYAAEFDRIEAAAVAHAEAQFALHATDAQGTLERWEELEGLPASPPGVPEADRRAKVLAMVRARRAAEGADWVEIMTAALGTTQWSHEDDFDDYTVRLNLPGTSSTYTARMAQAIARRVTPAHLELNFNFAGGFIVGESLVGDPL